MDKESLMTQSKDDAYVNDMDWGGDGVSIGSLNNYRQYQYDLIGKHIGTNILEVGSGASRSFTKLIVKQVKNLKRVLSIEPSVTLLEAFDSKSDFKFPESAEFRNCDVFDLDVDVPFVFEESHGSDPISLLDVVLQGRHFLLRNFVVGHVV